MVFIKPTILKDQLQISGLTAQRYAFMRERQLAFKFESVYQQTGMNPSWKNMTSLIN